MRSTTAAWLTPRLVDKLGLDLAQFDAEAADFDLIVDAAVEGDLAVGLHHHGVAGAVEDRIVSPVESKGLAMNFSAVSASRLR